MTRVSFRASKVWSYWKKLIRVRATEDVKPSLGSNLGPGTRSPPPLSHEAFCCWDIASICVIYNTDKACIPSVSCFCASTFDFRFEAAGTCLHLCYSVSYIQIQHWHMGIFKNSHARIAQTHLENDNATNSPNIPVCSNYRPVCSKYKQPQSTNLFVVTTNNYEPVCSNYN